MSEISPLAVQGERPNGRGYGRSTGSGASIGGDVRGLHLKVGMVPAGLMAFLGFATLTFLEATSPSPTATIIVVAVAAVGAVLLLAATFLSAESTTRKVHRKLAILRAQNARGHEDLMRLVERVQNGERFAPHRTDIPPATNLDPFSTLAGELRNGQHAAQNVVLQMATPAPIGNFDHRVEVFVNIARRMQSLVHQQIGLLDDLEAQVEDPILLKGLFTIDHLATRMRRQSESLAVLGGAASRRRWSRPVTMYEVLRSAVAEVEHYSRVKVVLPVEGTLEGGAVADVVHLVAELIENATRFSPPHTQVMLRAENVAAGLAIEIDDRGLGMQLADQHRKNAVLADPGRVSIGELLQDGRIGLFVVSTLARRHGVVVQLQSNVYGGVQAVVILPPKLIGSMTNDQEAESRPQPVAATSAPASTANTPAYSTGAAAYSTAPSTTTPSAGTSTAAYSAAPIADPLSDPLSAPLSGGSESFPGSDYVGSRRSSTRDERASNVAGAASATPLGDQAAHHSSTPRDAQGTGHEAAPSAQGTQAARSATRGTTAGAAGERPPLPERQVQQHLAPQLRDRPAAQGDEAEDDINPGLMAAFQGGVDRADDEDDPLGSADGTR